MVEVIFLNDLSGWADRDKRVKYHAAAGSTHAIDWDNAVDWVAKGYCAFKDKRHYKKANLSADLIAERKASVHNVRLGASHG